MPWSEVPPSDAVPYKVLLDKINPAAGMKPSLLVPYGAGKLKRFVNPVPLVLMANITPREPPPREPAVPYNVLPDKINPE